MNRQERWEKIRARGPWPFILRYGVLYWGIGTGLLFSIVFPIAANDDASFMNVLPLAIPLFCLGGLLWGFLMWKFMEKGNQGGQLTSEPDDTLDSE
ncbi:MAG: hypothetical protein HQ567_09815 [Candidatus Nealsonbacteria bacterium]|nr:hypothetical protein [Candidatus Nealsonbacteria bacterium]